MNLDVTSHPDGQRRDSYTTNTSGWTFGLEAGKRFLFEIGELWGDQNAQFMLEPRLQYNHTHIDGFSKRVHDLDLRADNYESRLLTLGAYAGLLVQSEYGPLEPYLKLNLKQEFDGKVKVRADAESDSRNFQGQRYEFGLGFNAQLGGCLGLYADASYEKGRRTESLGGNLGLRISF